MASARPVPGSIFCAVFLLAAVSAGADGSVTAVGATFSRRAGGGNALGAELVASLPDFPVLWAAAGGAWDSHAGVDGSLELGAGVPVFLGNKLVMGFLSASLGATHDDGPFLGFSLPVLAATSTLDKGRAPYVSPFVRIRPWRDGAGWEAGLGVKTTLTLPKLHLSM